MPLDESQAAEDDVANRESDDEITTEITRKPAIDRNKISGCNARRYDLCSHSLEGQGVQGRHQGGH